MPPVAKDAKKKAPKEKKERPPKDKERPARKSERPHDADAVQLFRRYDRARVGALLRSDFLQLLRDYARPPAHARAPAARRLPLSLSDSKGVPLGFERSEKNSEFEAGQLFERYDKDHSGTLTLDKFHDFFFDFQTQLRAFVDDLGNVEHVSSDIPAPAFPEPPRTTIPEAAPLSESPRPSSTSVRADYQAALWELRKLCRDELQQQRLRMCTEIDRIRDRLRTRADNPGSELERNLWPPDHRQTSGRSSWRDNQLADRYDSVEADLHRVDEILREMRRQLRIGMDASVEEMQDFINRSSVLVANAREIAMNVYNDGELIGDEPTREDRSQHNLPYRKEGKGQNDFETSNFKNSRDSETSKPKNSNQQHEDGPKENEAGVELLHKQLLIKDQLIYQLLQERATLRKQKALVESDLQELSQVSTHEMTKWAQLTDEMQEEIAALRGRLKSLERRYDSR